MSSTQRFSSTFAINGTELDKLMINSYAIKIEVLDGEATGRTKAPGWPMIRDPQGLITNLVLEFYSPEGSNNSQFRELWEACKRMGKVEDALIRFVDPTGSVLERRMYCVTAQLKYKRIEYNGVVFTDALQVSFIDMEGDKP